MKRAVTEETQATCVGRYIATDVTTVHRTDECHRAEMDTSKRCAGEEKPAGQKICSPALGAKVEGHHVTFVCNVVVQSFENAASVCHKRARDLVEAAHLVQVAQVDNDFVENRYTTAHQAGVTALRHNSKALFMAIPHDSRDLLCVLGLNHALALPLVFVHPVNIEARQFVCIDDLDA